MKRFIAAAASIAFTLSITPLYAATGDTAEEPTGFADILIDQIAPDDEGKVFGNWTLIRPHNKRNEADLPTFLIEDAEIGSYTFIADNPAGASAEIDLYRNGELKEHIDRQQVTFDLVDGENVRIVITYKYTRVGTVSVTSSPAGLEFTIKGPNNIEERGETPDSFLDMPEGLYTVYFDAIEDCVTPKPKSDKLLKGNRVNLNIDVSCDDIENKVVQVQEQKTLSQYVTVTIDGKQVPFLDVFISEWYAPYVHTVAKTGVITGYRDSNGDATGVFGASDNVTLAQLAKIAHQVSSTDEEKIRTEVRNTRAQGTWFERYYASAEQRWWMVYQNQYTDPSRNATRAEVVATLLQAMNVQRVWPQGKLFTDVLPTDRYAASIETAATDGFVAGYHDGTFRPDAPVNRAELSKIVATLMEFYGEDTAEFTGRSN